jgi:hypothetical protein
VEYIILKRQKNLDYVKRVHEGKVFWLNLVRISKANILNYYSPDVLQERALGWLILGLSCSKLLEMADSTCVVRALYQLLEEYEYFMSKLKKDENNRYDIYTDFVFTTSHISTSQRNFSPKDPVKAKIHTNSKGIAKFEHLYIPTLPGQGNLDYCEVLFTLCDVLSLVYGKTIDHNCLQNPIICEAILKIDKRIKSIFFTKVCNDLTLIAQPLLKEELNHLLSGSFFDSSGKMIVLHDDDKGEDKNHFRHMFLAEDDKL